MRVRSSCVLLGCYGRACRLGFTGCHGTANALSRRRKERSQTYPVRGTVISTDPANGEVLLKHDDIPGLMPAMTMPYHLEIHPSSPNFTPATSSPLPCSPITTTPAPPTSA